MSNAERITGFVDRTSVLLVVIAGLVVVLIGYLVTKVPEANTGTTLTAFLGVVGTIVGAFFGIKVGAAGGERIAEKAEQKREKAEKMLNFVHGLLPKSEFESLMRDYPDFFVPPKNGGSRTVGANEQRAPRL